MNRKFPFSEGEWYHCYSRGIDKRTVFTEESDLVRFMEIPYLANDSIPLRRADIETSSASEIFSIQREQPLVAIGAYALMSNHYHLLIKEIQSGGISAFMRKVGTSYTMYFNTKYERTGNLFVKPFRAKHVDEDRYFQHIVNYIHLNPVEIFEPGWKEGRGGSLIELEARLKSYPYSSLLDHAGVMRPMNSIIHPEIFSIANKISLQETLAEFDSFYKEIAEFEY